MDAATLSGPTVASLQPVAAFAVEVVALERLSPSFLRVTFGGDDLDGFADCGPLGPRDLRVKLVLPARGEEPFAAWEFGEGWYPRWLALASQVRGEMRTYTVRRVLPGGRVVVDVVLHDDRHGDLGPAGRWAWDARLGDRLTLLGPRRGADVVDDYRGVEWRPPASARDVLLVGDETAVPAIASVLDALAGSPSGVARARAVLEVPTPLDVLEVPSPPGTTVTWLPRCGRPHGQALLEQVGAELGAVPDHAWVAGEAATVRAVRRRLVREAMPREAVTFMGYWRADHRPD